jgi:hypothetical protein
MWVVSSRFARIWALARWQCPMRNVAPETVRTVRASPATRSRAAYRAATTSYLEPLVALIHPAMKWRGPRQLCRFWRPPS